MSEAAQTIVVRRVKKGGHGHHGGAWKVAFADFVTAMMAFFLLLWLLSSTTEDQRAGISEYFQNPAATVGNTGSSNAAIDLGGGMISYSTETPPDIDEIADVSQDRPAAEAPLDEETVLDEARELEMAHLEALKAEIEELIESSTTLSQFRDQLLIDIINEGLRVQIVDKENRPMFDSGSATLKPYTGDILAAIAQVVKDIPNKISVTGHTDQTPYANSAEGYSNWELSADRANAARRTLVAAGLPEDHIGRIVGLGSSLLFDATDPFNPVNRRISLIVMNKAAEAALSEESDGGDWKDLLEGL